MTQIITTSSSSPLIMTCIALITQMPVPTECHSDQHDSQDPTDLICFTETPNAFIKTDDNRFYLFIHQYVWEMDFIWETNEFRVHHPNATLISEEWIGLPPDVDIGFTVERSVFGNPVAGHTFFVKNQTWYRFRNNQFIDSGIIDLWMTGRPAHEWRYVATNRNSSMVLINNMLALGSKTSGKAYYFDDPYVPEQFETYHSLRPTIPWNHLRSLFPMPDENKYMAVLKAHGNGFYCVMNTYESECSYQPIHQMFNCSSDVLLLKQNDWIYWVWRTTRLNTRELLVVISGAVLAALFINVLLFTISVNRYIEIA